MGLARLGRAVGAGLETFGISETIRKDKEEETRKFEQQEARKERQLRIQEDEAKQRKEMNELKLQQEKALFNNKSLMQAYVAAKGDKQMIGAAMTNYVNDGRVYHYNPAESEKTGTVVYDVGTRTRKANGGFEMDMTTGLPKVTPLPLGTGKAIFADDDALNQHIIMNADPTILLSRERAKDKAENLRKAAKDMLIDKFAVSAEAQAEAEKTPEGARFIEKHKAEIDSVRARTQLTIAQEQEIKDKKDRPGKGIASQAPTSKVRDVRGEEQGLTDAEKQIAISNQKSFEKRGFEGITVQESFRLAQLGEDPQAKNEIASGLEMVKRGDMTRAEFRSLADDYNVPTRYFDNMLDKADELGEIEEEEAEAGKGGFFKKALNLVEFLINPAGKITRGLTAPK